MKLFLVLLFSCVSCVSAPKQLKRASLDRDMVIPDGVYNQKISLLIKEGKRREMSFKGVVEIGQLRIQVIGLSPFGTTEFRLEEDRMTGAIDIEVYREAMKKAESKIRDYYSVLRLLLTALKEDERFVVTQRNEKGFPEEMAIEDTHFSLSEFDKNQIPMRLKIENKEFSVEVKVTSYEI